MQLATLKETDTPPLSLSRCYEHRLPMVSACLYTNTCARKTHAQADGHERAHTDRQTDGRAERQADTQADQDTSRQTKLQSGSLRHEHA